MEIIKVARKYQIDCAKALFDSVDGNCDTHPVAAVPTGAGKTLIICEFIDQYLTAHPHAHILVLSHVKEILEQDHDAIHDHFDIDIGLWSKGLDSKTIRKITVAGIQSAVRAMDSFSHFDIVIIDECHLVTIRQNGMYRKFLDTLTANYVGLTATHFRLGHGYIHQGPGALFNKLAFDLSSAENFNTLVEDGYLTRLISKATLLRLDPDGIKIRAGDYVTKQMSAKFDREAITAKAIEEVLEFGKNYKKWLVFTIDIEHAEHVAEALNNRGIATACIHSKMGEDRTQQINGFRGDKYRAIVNVDILTTGLDVPSIDLIVMLRPTQSPVLHVQTIGRGLRVHPGKDHCLVLDFAGNSARLGPINDVTVKVKLKGKGVTGRQMMKECEYCKVLNHLRAKVCHVCGTSFKIRTKLSATAGSSEIVKVHSTPEWHSVDAIHYHYHRPRGKTPSMKVTYRSGLKTFVEYVCYDHEGYAMRKAINWVRFRMPNEPSAMPNDVPELLKLAREGVLKKPTEVLVDLNDKWPTIRDSHFD